MTLRPSTRIFGVLFLSTLLPCAFVIGVAQANISRTSATLLPIEQHLVDESTLLPPAPLPDFSVYESTTEKKAAFVNYLTPIVVQANRIALERRQILIALQQQETYSEKERLFLQKMATIYKEPIDGHPDAGFFQRLLTKVDALPASLVIAQAANESAWGTSRFARSANNLFGQWCFSPGCGLVPRQRPRGASHEVARYYSVEQSVRRYLENINSHDSYETLRHLRTRARESGQSPTGTRLAEGLLAYSARGSHYVKDIQGLIRANKLDALDPLSASHR